MQFVTIFGYIKLKPIGVKDVQDTFFVQDFMVFILCKKTNSCRSNGFLVIGKSSIFGTIFPIWHPWPKADKVASGRFVISAKI